MDKNKAETFRNSIRIARKSQELTLSEVSQRIGISITYLSQIERGEKVPPLEDWPKYMKAVGVDWTPCPTCNDPIQGCGVWATSSFDVVDGEGL